MTTHEEAAVDPERFRGAGDAFPGHWWAYPANWSERPEEVVLGRETLRVVTDAIEQLPELFVDGRTKKGAAVETISPLMSPKSVPSHAVSSGFGMPDDSSRGIGSRFARWLSRDASDSTG